MIRRPDAAAEGPSRRHRLPLDAGARPDPLRRRPREDEHLRHSRPPSARSPRPNGSMRGTSGTSSATMSSCRTTRSCATARWCRDKIQLDDVMHPEHYKEMPENQRLLDPPLGRPDELPLLERAVPGRSDDQRRAGAATLLRGDAGLQDGRFPHGRRQIQGRASSSGRRVMDEFPDLS